MFANSARDFEIETLLHHNHRHEGDEVYPVIHSSVESDFPTPEYFTGKSRSRHPSSQQAGKGECSAKPRYDSASSSDEDEPEQQYITISVNGADIGDLPTQYTVEGLRRNEFPVIGTYVDKRILPGFRYRVRKLGGLNPERYLFKGKALTLQSVGMGYGKRITFEGDRLNENPNYFYSDTNPAGFGLTLVAVEPNHQFTVTAVENEHPVAEARVVEVFVQEEIDYDVDEDRNLVKEVRVSFAFDVKYASDFHGLMPLYSDQRLQASGIAIVRRQKGSRKAFTTFVEDIELPHHGLVTLRA